MYDFETPPSWKQTFSAGLTVLFVGVALWARFGPFPENTNLPQWLLTFSLLCVGTDMGRALVELIIGIIWDYLSPAQRPGEKQA